MAKKGFERVKNLPENRGPDLPEGTVLRSHYSTSECCKVAGVAVGTLNVWINRDILSPTAVPEERKGKGRVFSIRNVVEVTAIATLARMNQPIQAAAAAVGKFGGRAIKPGDVIVLSLAGNQIEVSLSLPSPDQAPSAMLILDMWKLAKDVEAKLIEISDGEGDLYH